MLYNMKCSSYEVVQNIQTTVWPFTRLHKDHACTAHVLNHEPHCVPPRKCCRSFPSEAAVKLQVEITKLETQLEERSQEAKSLGAQLESKKVGNTDTVRRVLKV